MPAPIPPGETPRLHGWRDANRYEAKLLRFGLAMAEAFGILWVSWVKADLLDSDLHALERLRLNQACRG